jgi:ribosome-associated protein
LENRARVEINEDLSIPEEELDFTASRSGGPGGQHVNKTSSRVTLFFDVDASPSLTEEQKRRLRARLSTRISRAGVLRVVCQRSRSQAANRTEAVERFAELLREALKRRRPRRRSGVPNAERRRRLEGKRRRAQVKRLRGRPPTSE